MKFVLLAISIPLIAQGTYHRPLVPIPPGARLSDVVQPYSPQTFISGGGGDQAPGRGAGFLYGSISHYLGQQNWATGIIEESIGRTPDGSKQIVTSTLGGISHVLGETGPISYGLVGAAGASSGAPTGASPTLEAQVFGNVHMGGSWNVIASLRRNFIQPVCNPGVPAMVCAALQRPVMRFTLGIGWGK